MRLFEILDKLNQDDAGNGITDGRAKVIICPDVIAANMYTNHGDVKFGLPVEVARKLTMSPERYKAISVIIDMDEYNKLSND